MNLEKEPAKECYEIVISFSNEDVEEFARISGDFNPLHLNEEFAIAQGFSGRIIHGALVISKVSGIIASEFPGVGTILGSIDWKFKSPVFINQQLKLIFTLSKTHSRKGLLDLVAINDAGCVVQESRMVVFIKQ